MTVTVLLFASFADALGASSLDVQLPAGSTVSELLRRIAHLPGANRLPPQPLVAVNRSYAPSSLALNPGDEIALIPPVAGGMMRTAIVEVALDPPAILAEVASTSNGATVLFVGTVREVNEGRAVTGIDYAAYGAMAESELHAIVREAAAQHGTDDIVAEHRIGTLGLGDASIAIAVGHPHRAAAFDAARMVIEQVKMRVPIWKREHYADGTREWIEPARPVVQSP